MREASDLFTDLPDPSVVDVLIEEDRHSDLFLNILPQGIHIQDNRKQYPENENAGRHRRHGRQRKHPVSPYIPESLPDLVEK